MSRSKGVGSHLTPRIVLFLLLAIVAVNSHPWLYSCCDYGIMVCDDGSGCTPMGPSAPAASEGICDDTCGNGCDFFVYDADSNMCTLYNADIRYSELSTAVDADSISGWKGCTEKEAILSWQAWNEWAYASDCTEFEKIREGSTSCDRTIQDRETQDLPPLPTTSGNWGDYVVESCNGVNYTKRTCGDFEGDGCDGDAFFCFPLVEGIPAERESQTQQQIASFKCDGTCEDIVVEVRQRAGGQVTLLSWDIGFSVPDRQNVTGASDVPGTVTRFEVARGVSNYVLVEMKAGPGEGDFTYDVLTISAGNAFIFSFNADCA